jgi:hypothetical protein
MHPAPKEGNYCDEYGNATRPKIIEDYNQHMGYVDKSDRMANSYSISRRAFKWTKKLFFRLIDLTILNSWIPLSSCGANYSHRNFRLILVGNLVEGGGKNERLYPLMRGRPNSAIQNIVRLESRQNEHWPAKGNKLRCRVCSAPGKTAQTIYQCAKCQVGLCVLRCFQDYHTKTNIVINISSGQTGERHEKGEYNKIIIMTIIYVNYIFYDSIYTTYFFMPIDKLKI